MSGLLEMLEMMVVQWLGTWDPAADSPGFESLFHPALPVCLEQAPQAHHHCEGSVGDWVPGSCRGTGPFTWL